MTAKNALALHTWTLDTTPLADLLKIVRSTGWDAVELRRLDWERADKAGQPASAVVDQAKASGLRIACVGVEAGWIWASGEERARLFRVVDEQCARAASLGGARMHISQLRAAACGREVRAGRRGWPPGPRERHPRPGGPRPADSAPRS